MQELKEATAFCIREGVIHFVNKMYNIISGADKDSNSRILNQCIGGTPWGWGFRWPTKPPFHFLQK